MAVYHIVVWRTKIVSVGMRKCDNRDSVILTVDVICDLERILAREHNWFPRASGGLGQIGEHYY
jgi:hypothetical protein